MAVTFRIQRHGACLDSSIEVFRCFDAELSLASAKPPFSQDYLKIQPSLRIAEGGPEIRGGDVGLNLTG